jgi:hypothetical protein
MEQYTSSDAGEQASMPEDNGLLVSQEEPSVQPFVSQPHGKDNMDLSTTVPETLDLSQEHDNADIGSPAGERNLKPDCQTPRANRSSPAISHNKPLSGRRSSSTSQSATGSRELPIVIEDETSDIAMPDFAHGGDTVPNSPDEDTNTHNKDITTSVEDILRYPTKRKRSSIFEDQSNENMTGMASPTKRKRRACEDQPNINRNGMVSWSDLKHRHQKRIRRRQQETQESWTGIFELPEFREMRQTNDYWYFLREIETHADIVAMEKAYHVCSIKVLKKIKTKSHKESVVNLGNLLKRLLEELLEFAADWGEEWTL